MALYNQILVKEVTSEARWRKGPIPAASLIARVLILYRKKKVNSAGKQPTIDESAGMAANWHGNAEIGDPFNQAAERQ
jgi:hypothetical protein